MDIHKHDLQPLKQALSGEFSVYAIDVENPGQDDVSLTPLMQLMVEIDKTLHDNDIPIHSEDYRMYIGNKSIPASFYQFGSHVLAGRMPFLFYRDLTGNVLGALLLLEYHERQYDPKVIQRRIQALIEQSRPTPNPISHKDAKKQVQDEIKAGKKLDGLPIIEKRTQHYLYFDFEHQQMLVKNSHRNSTLAHHSVLFLNRFVAQLATKNLGSKALHETAKVTAQLQPLPTPFSVRSINESRAKQSYNIDALVACYARQDAAPHISATDSADLRVKDEASQKIKLKNSLSTIANRDVATEDHFMTLLRFANEKTCDITALSVLGSIPTPRIVKQFIEMFPESVYDEIRGTHIELTYLTKSVQGNVTFSIRKGGEIVADAARKIIEHELINSPGDFRQLQSSCSQWFGEMLSVLHESSILFIKCYLESAAVSAHFDKQEAAA